MTEIFDAIQGIGLAFMIIGAAAFIGYLITKLNVRRS